MTWRVAPGCRFFLLHHHLKYCIRIKKNIFVAASELPIPRKLKSAFSHLYFLGGCKRFGNEKTKMVRKFENPNCRIKHPKVRTAQHSYHTNIRSTFCFEKKPMEFASK